MTGNISRMPHHSGFANHRSTSATQNKGREAGKQRDREDDEEASQIKSEGGKEREKQRAG